MLSLGKALLFLCSICLRTTNIDAQSCENYTLRDELLEGQGVYTGERISDTILVFEVSERSMATSNSSETASIQNVTVREPCLLTKISISPNLTEILKEQGDVCRTTRSRGTRDIYSLLGRKFMSVWTFSIPARQCLGLKFLIQVLQGRNDYYDDRLTILHGEQSLPVVLKAGVSEYEFPVQSGTAMVTVVYFYTSESRSANWQMTPSLKSSDCIC